MEIEKRTEFVVGDPVFVELIDGHHAAAIYRGACVTNGIDGLPSAGISIDLEGRKVDLSWDDISELVPLGEKINDVPQLV
jgi:hypothetical protein